MKHWLFVCVLLLIGLAACTTPTAPPESEAPTAPRSSQPTATAVAPTTAPTATPFPPTETPIPGVTPTVEPTVPLAELQNIVPEDPLPGSSVDVVASDLDGPVSFAFAPDGRLFFTEKATGNVRVIVDGALLPEPVLTLPVASLGEQGLIGIAIDPDFDTNHHIWVTHVLPAETEDGDKVNRVIRFTEENNQAVDVQVALTIPNMMETDRHTIGNIAFGPDGMLYLSIGDGLQAGLSQRLTEPRGKIFRFEPTVPLQAAEDNPFYDGAGPNYDAIYAYGFRNPFDFTFDPLSETRKIFATGNGTHCDDEINLVLAGHNYGWFDGYVCRDEQPLNPAMNTIPPLLSWSPTTAPAGIMVYTGDDFPEWYGDIFFCTFQDAKLHRLELNESRDAIISHSAINGMYCQVDVLNGPDGALYFLEGGGFSPGTLKRLSRPEG